MIDRQKIEKAILQDSKEKQLACRSAFQIASENGCTTQEVGAICNELKIKIVGCQLGCF